MIKKHTSYVEWVDEIIFACVVVGGRVYFTTNIHYVGMTHILESIIIDGIKYDGEWYTCDTGLVTHVLYGINPWEIEGFERYIDY